ncbi:DUF2007 domain-containing protein [Sinimarinibacterium thermocellulolyticum]|uniref:DUF2007 domain-containing protein n=1 Tax=Sinimarinibacterium thermocellulolyticum TaxID=3170016 RepID=A0ABV2A6M8_9GAMM
MIPVYSAADPVEAEILRAFLAAHGIETVVLGAPLWGARGELQADVYPRLALRDEADEAHARELLRQYERRRHAHACWPCVCGECSPVTFEVCWSCGSERPA